MAERNEPHAGGNPVRHHGGQESMQRRRQRDAVTGAGDADRDRIGDRTVPKLRAMHRARHRAMPLRDIDKGAAQRRRFKMALARRHKGGCKFGELSKTGVVSLGDGAVGVGEEDTVAQTRAQRSAWIRSSRAKSRRCRYRRPRPPIRCRSKKQTRRPDRPAKARSSAGRARRLIEAVRAATARRGAAARHAFAHRPWSCP